MITGELKNKIDALRQIVWNGGTSNPITVVEQLTYLMFIHSLDERELEIERFEALGAKSSKHIFPSSAIGQSMRWSKFKDKTAQEIHYIIKNLAFPAIKEMKGGKLPDFNDKGEIIPIEGGETENSDFTSFSQFMSDASFVIDDPLVLQKVITSMDSLFQNEFAQNRDLEGDFYEYMLNQMASSGELGQFRTPKHIRDMMVEMMQPTPDDLICDPACGTAGFLLSAATYIRERNESIMTDIQWENYYGPAFTGFDTDPTMTRLSSMNLVLHGVTHPQIKRQDSVSKKNPIVAKYDLILANPPFTGSVDKSSIDENLKAITNTAKTELLFVALFLRMLKIGGRCACVVPNGVLFGATNAHKALRKELIENHNLIAVISMPAGVFRPYSDVSTGILVFTKTNHGGTENVWFYDMQADGVTIESTRDDGSKGDIDDILNRFRNIENERNRLRTDQSFLVPLGELRKNEYSLNVKKYRETVFTQEEFPPTAEIIDRLHHNIAIISNDLKELEELL